MFIEYTFAINLEYVYLLRISPYAVTYSTHLRLKCFILNQNAYAIYLDVYLYENGSFRYDVFSSPEPKAHR